MVKILKRAPTTTTSERVLRLHKGEGKDRGRGTEDGWMEWMERLRMEND